ncbi:MAG TPA: DMT family transporter [Thiobacillaceae bacterium]|nr:DMT family transporter [Thiobacillaceae bacterium]
MGSAWMLVAGAGFALMGVFVKLAGHWFSSQELVFYRSLVGFAMLLGLLTLRHGVGGGRHFLGGHLWLQVRRGLVGFVALVAFFFAIARLPLSVAITLNYTSPLFLALLMPWWLGERPRASQYATVALGFLGVALLLRPWEGSLDQLAALVGLGSGLLAAFAYIHVRQLGKLAEPEWRTVFWFTVVSGAGAALLTGIHGWHPVNRDNLPMLLALGLAATVGQLAMTRAYRKGDTVVVAALAYSTVVFGSLLDVVIWRHVLPPLAWLGMAVTVGAGVWAIRLNNPRRTKESK